MLGILFSYWGGRRLIIIVIYYYNNCEESRKTKFSQNDFNLMTVL